jgi:hypothetical protein
VLTIHLQKRNRNPDGFDLASVAAATDGFTGSELEQTIKDALYRGFADGRREPTTDDLLTCTKSIVPLSVTAKETIESIRAWARNRARFASRPHEGVPVEETAPKRRLVGVVGIVAENAPPDSGEKGSN